MVKLHFKYASMNSGKSIDLMRTVHNYEELGFKALVMKPKVDTKAGNQIESRIGLRRKVDVVLDETDSVVKCLTGKLEEVKSIFVDEAQFLSSAQVDELFIISKVKDIPIICYGLRTDFKMHSFEGSRRLLEISDILEEIQTLCHCGKIARYVGRKKNGKYEVNGPSVIIDGTDDYEYLPLCGQCYLKEVKGVDFDMYKGV